ncbi:MAG: hypothetical protein KGO50_08335 [Myxococcales bacterium]|nr:hypothetical protein [Myxococcales bacterium]
MSDYPEQGDQFEFDTLVRRMISIADPVMRRRQLQRHVLSVDPLTFAQHLQQMVTQAIRGDSDAMELLFSLIEYMELADGRDALALEAVNLAARAESLLAIGWMLLNPPPMRSVDKLLLRQRGKALTLGERKALATGFDRTRIDALLHDNDPAVIERLCRNPRVQEQHVMTMATLRPTTPELLQVIAREPRWARRAAIREALVQNPFIGTGLALRLLPTLPIPALERLRHASELHPAVRDFALYLLALRLGREKLLQIPSYEVVKPSFLAPIDETQWQADDDNNSEANAGDYWDPDDED